jgi:hypothetical protein
MNVDHPQAKIKILSEEVLSDQIEQVTVGCRDQADVDLYRFFSPETLERVSFQDAEQFCLTGETHLPDFVEENRASVCPFELPNVPTVGSREGANLVTEQLAL